jgi:hypothetical protein
MTVSTTRTYNADIAAVLRMAFRRCGLLNEHQDLDEAKSKVGREELDALIDFLEVEGIAARQRTFETITLVSGTRDYTLSATTLDVEGDGAFIAVGQDVDAAAGETVVQPMTIQDWQTLPAKNATGRPFRYYPDRTSDQIVVKLWATPGDTEDGASVRFVVHRLSADNLNGSNTVDKERYWRDYLVWALAERFAFAYSIPGSLRMELGRKAEAALGKCRGAAAPTNPTDFRLGHRTGWSH